MTLDLNCADFYDVNKGNLKFPPEGVKQYATKVDRKSIKAIIKELGNDEKLVLVAQDGGLTKEDNEMIH